MQEHVRLGADAVAAATTRLAGLASGARVLCERLAVMYSIVLFEKYISPIIRI